MPSEIRATAPGHATGAVEFVPLEDIADDERFRLRPDGDVAELASSVGRLGQLLPIELRPWPGAASDGPRWQVVSGFRRLAALKLLHRDRVLARVHSTLPDDEAWSLALVQAVLDEPLSAPDLEALRARMAAEGAAPWASDLLDDALVRAPIDPELRERFYDYLKAGAPAAEPHPEPEVLEVEADDLLRGLATRLYEVNQDLATAFASWKDLPLEGRQLVLTQARYIAELFPFLLEGSRE